MKILAKNKNSNSNLPTNFIVEIQNQEMMELMGMGSGYHTNEINVGQEHKISEIYNRYHAMMRQEALLKDIAEKASIIQLNCHAAQVTTKILTKKKSGKN